MKTPARQGVGYFVSICVPSSINCNFTPLRVESAGCVKTPGYYGVAGGATYGRLAKRYICQNAGFLHSNLLLLSKRAAQWLICVSNVNDIKGPFERWLLFHCGPTSCSMLSI